MAFLVLAVCIGLISLFLLLLFFFSADVRTILQINNRIAYICSPYQMSDFSPETTSYSRQQPKRWKRLINGITLTSNGQKHSVYIC